MTDLFATLAAIAAWAASVALLTSVARRGLPKSPPAPAPRRNFDVLAPRAPRTGATRRAHDATVVGIWGPEWLIIRDDREARDARQ